MSLLLNGSDIDTLRWVLRCYLADRAVKHGSSDSGSDVDAMFEAADADRRAVIALLMRFDADVEQRRLPATAPRTAPVPARPRVMLPVAAAATSALAAM